MNSSVIKIRWNSLCQEEIFQLCVLDYRERRRLSTRESQNHVVESSDCAGDEYSQKEKSHDEHSSNLEMLLFCILINHSICETGSYKSWYTLCLYKMTAV